MNSSRSKTQRTLQIDRSSLAEQMAKAQKAERRACFVILGGLDVGSVLTLKDDQTIVGRDPACDMVLRDDGISRRHVRVRRIDSQHIEITDLGSTNGTFVGGEKVSSAQLRDGDKVLLGRRTVLKFVLYDDIEHQYQETMYESSTCDALTGVFNRKYFDEKLVTYLSFARRHRVPFTLILLDIDHFKKVNDTFGHRTGDDVLRSVSDVVRKMIRTEDSLSRYGGEEFAIIAQGTDVEGGLILAERVRKKVSQTQIATQATGSIEIRVTVSLGVATVGPGVEISPEKLIEEADKNLYKAKENGRNQTVGSELANALERSRQERQK